MVEQGHTLIRPYIEKYKEKHGAYPTGKQIHTEAGKLSLEDYTLDLSLQWLKELELVRRAMIHEQGEDNLLRRRHQNNAAQRGVQSKDAELVSCARLLTILERFVLSAVNVQFLYAPKFWMVLIHRAGKHGIIWKPNQRDVHRP